MKTQKCAWCGNEYLARNPGHRRKSRYCSKACLGKGNTPALIHRFWSKVAIRSFDECWPWTGRTNNHGYGRLIITRDGHETRQFAHRLIFELIADAVPTGVVVMHTCDNPPCVNPRHLRIGTQTDNIRDAQAKGRMNLKGLARGRVLTFPPHPCRRCGTEVENGRNWYCPPCRLEAERDRSRRYRARQREQLRRRRLRGAA